MRRESMALERLRSTLLGHYQCFGGIYYLHFQGKCIDIFGLFTVCACVCAHARMQTHIVSSCVYYHLC